ncbi:MAG: DUF362 domain-containing protein [Desulfohalobiaceae bacterium]|nr:DUF362 domain-containing protein [Desulfohalobiaceae bacterium]
MAVVSLARCRSYEADELTGVIGQSLSHIGFAADRFQGAKVVVKPNLLTVAAADRAILTHPEFFRAVVQIVKAHGGRPVLVESPAVHSLERVIRKTGYAVVVDEEKVEVADPTAVRTLHFQGAKRFKHLDISAAYFDADMILGLPKLKTHGITFITGAVKLLFGAMPGLEKSKMHLRLPSPQDFADFLLNFYAAMLHGLDPPKPLLYIMDAILALEGEGPGQGGSPRRMNAILAGEDAIALDWVATRLAGLDITKALTITHGFQRDFGVASPKEIQTAGEQLDDLPISNFIPATGNSQLSNSFRWPLNTRTFRTSLWSALCPYPIPARSAIGAGRYVRPVRSANPRTENQPLITITRGASGAIAVWKSARKGPSKKRAAGFNGCWVFWNDERLLQPQKQKIRLKFHQSETEKSLCFHPKEEATSRNQMRMYISIDFRQVFTGHHTPASPRKGL